MSPCLDISGIPKMENGINGKTATSVYFLKTENGNGKFLFVCSN
jgi:hypothetical protein